MTDVERSELAPGYSVARVINGCWQLTPDHGGGPDSRKSTLRRFAELVDHGFTSFDCADIYEGTEELLGEFRKSLDDPETIQVHTKFVPDRATLASLTDATIDAVIDRSRKRLDTDSLDLVQFHWWDYDVPGLDRMYDRLLRAQSAGRIRHLGVTNFDTLHLETLLERSASIVSMQAQYSLLDRRPERQMSASCAAHGVSLLPYGVLAGGFLSEKYLGRPEPRDMNRSLTKYRLIIDEIGGWAALQRLLEQLSSIATKHDTTISTIAARWVLDQPAVGAVILGIGKESRVQQNIAVSHIELDDADREDIARCLDTLGIPAGDPYDLERDPDGVHAGIIRSYLQDAGLAQ